MEKHINCDKMIFAVLQGDDYRVAIENLNTKGFYAMVLHSTGGFLKKRSVTLMLSILFLTFILGKNSFKY